LIIPSLTRLDRRKLWTLLGGTWLLAFLAPVAYLATNPDGLPPIDWISEGNWLKVVKYNPLIRLPEFVFGIGLGLLCGPQAQSWARAGRGSRGGWTLAAVAGIAAILCCSERIPYVILHNALLLPLFGLLLWDLALGGGPIGWLLSRRSLVLLGDASYALYILHFSVIAVAFGWMWLVLGGGEFLEREAARQKAQAGASPVAASATAPAASPQAETANATAPTKAVHKKWNEVIGPAAFIVVVSSICTVFSIAVHKLIEIPCRRVLRRRLNRAQHLAVPPILHSDLP